jgi:large subunit ribosomal protein L6
MSRIGRMPVVIPAGVEIKINGQMVTVTGPKGTLTQSFHKNMMLETDGKTLLVKRPDDEKVNRALHGLTRALLNNMVVGATTGFAKSLDIVGVGYRAQKLGKKLVLTLGYSHPVEMEEPQGITFEVPAQDKVIVRGADKQLVGEIAAQIRDKRPPEPYKGKGVRYTGEVVLRKEGKTGGKGKK